MSMKFLLFSLDGLFELLIFDFYKICDENVWNLTNLCIHVIASTLVYL